MSKNMKYSASPSHSTHHDSIDKRRTNSYDNRQKILNSYRSKRLNEDIYESSVYKKSYHDKTDAEVTFNSKESKDDPNGNCDSSDRRQRRSSSKENTDDSFNSSKSSLPSESRNIENEVISEGCNRNKRKRDVSGSHSDSIADGQRSDKRTKFTSERENVRNGRTEEITNGNKFNGHMADKKSRSSDLLHTS